MTVGLTVAFPLTKIHCHLIKHFEIKQYQANMQRLAGKHGLYLLVLADSVKKSELWCYCFEDKCLRLSLGKYPAVYLPTLRFSYAPT
jgi:hypothetical protein